MFIINTIISFLKDEHYRELLIITIGILIIGTFSYHYLEGWSYLDALYFSVVTLTTIGYGDLYPVTKGGKIFTIIYIILGLGIILGFINTIFKHYQDERKMKKDRH
jgi:voltage-gated potassium channel